VCRGTPTTYSVTNVAGVTYTWTLQVRMAERYR
jgi:hypothetical protein